MSGRKYDSYAKVILSESSLLRFLEVQSSLSIASSLGLSDLSEQNNMTLS